MTTKKHTATGEDDKELEALAHHLAEVLRITREHPDIPAQLYDDIAEGWNDFVNRTPPGGLINDSEEMIRLELIGGVRLRKAEGKPAK